MSNRLDDIIDTFQSVDPQMRLELLLDFSRRLPPLPERYRAERDAGLHRVHECQTPVFIWVAREDGGVKIHADVAEESPTVSGLLAILIKAYDGAGAREIADLPADLLDRLGLADLIRMNRAVGISAVVGRIKREAAQLEDTTAE